MSHTTIRPGSMTQAMTAKHSNEPKVLRLGVVYNGRVVDERIIRERQTITAGPTERCTLSLRKGTVEAPIELLIPHGDRFALVLHQGSELRMATALGPCTLEALRTQNRVITVGDREIVPLDATDRGKLSLGDVTFLFQYVNAPPVMPRAQLPESLKSSYVRNADWRYNGCLAGFLALGLSTLGYVEYIYDPIVPTESELQARYRVALELPNDPVTNPEPTRPVSDTQEGAENVRTPMPNPVRPHPVRPVPHGPAPDTVARAEREADRLMESLRHTNDATFNPLTAALNRGSGPASAHSNPNGLQENNVDAINHTTGITTNPSAVHSRSDNTTFLPPGPLGYTRLQHTGPDIVTPLGPQSERVITTVYRVHSPVAPEHNTCDVDATSVARSFRQNLGGMRSCYERATRNDPNLAGRVTVSFTVGGSGRASGVHASGLNPELHTCLQGVVQRIVFSRPTCESSADFTFPISFDSGAR